MKRMAQPRSSLAYHAGWLSSACVSLALVGAHITFGYAQLSDVWEDCEGSCGPVGGNNSRYKAGQGMAMIEAVVNVDWDATGFLADALGLTEKGICATSCPKGQAHAVHPSPITDTVCGAIACDECSLVLGNPAWASQSCRASLNTTVNHMSYFYGISHMYKENSCGSVHQPGCDEDYPGRPAAIVIFGFSFVWPHVKLVLMHLFYYLPLEPGTRRNGNCALHPPMRPSNRRHTGPASTGAH